MPNSVIFGSVMSLQLKIMVFKCFVSEQDRLNREIERQFEIDRREMKKQYKLLLLGTGESGKSTFIKQVQLLHTGFTAEERNRYTGVVKENIIDSVKSLARAMQTFGYEDSESFGFKILDERTNVAEIGDLVLGAYIKQFWEDPMTQKTFNRRCEFQLCDSTEYFLNSVDRIFRRDYVPTNQDIMRARVPTTGIVDYSFKLPNSIVFRMVDVGGQRSERRKWVHCFEKVTCILFMTAISEFDQKLRESDDEDVSRFQESLLLFRVIVDEKYFRDCGVILLLNKIDIFKEKIARLRLNDYFPQYTGPEHDVEEAKNFMHELFFDSCPEYRLERLFSHFTCATDTEAMKFIFEAVKECVLRRILGEIILY